MRRVILAFGAAVLLAIASFGSVAADGLGPPNPDRLPATESGNVPTGPSCGLGIAGAAQLGGNAGGRSPFDCSPVFRI